ncbi:hypothetical protein [Haloterrigena salifodinae]|uniref:hypothetical protein n=1 Tax=Haloterrigena salifodinae TaxID=2675099 RepID=UPI000F89AA52|nr:hypothetical protein [Haloterrigena salifodinae]
MATPNAVIAKLHNQASYEEGFADEALDPGTGCVIYEDENGEKRVRSANADEATSRVVREARNPPRGLGVEGESPLSQSYSTDEHVETVGFGDHDQARCQVSDATADDAVGWDADGALTSTGSDGTGDPGTIVGHVKEIIDVDGTDMAIVEFE